MSERLKRIAAPVVLVCLLAVPVSATIAIASTSINAGEREAVAQNPFAVETIAEFNTPWAIAFLPDQRLLVTEKGGKIFIADRKGNKTAVDNVPAVSYQGQNGLLDIKPAPDFAESKAIYFTYAKPQGGQNSSLTLARAVLHEAGGKAALRDVQTIWQQDVALRGGQPGGIIAFQPDGQQLYLTVGDRMAPAHVQDDDAPLGKILRMNLDGSVPADNPKASERGVKALTWTTGHRNPYGLAFAPDGKLWQHEMGPKGGDEFNLIRQGLNYGWPEVSNGDQYSGQPIPRHATRPEFEAPTLYWTPVIAPAGLAFYQGDMFKDWQGSALIGGLASMALVRVAFDAAGQPDEAERYDMENRIRDVAVADDGAVWLIEDASAGRLLRLTPKQ